MGVLGKEGLGLGGGWFRRLEVLGRRRELVRYG